MGSAMRLPAPALVHFLALCHLVRSTCFLPNGTANPSLGAAPCSSDPSNPLSAVCCNTKWSNPPGGDLKFGQPQDECLPNGLCQNRGMSTKQGDEMPPWTHFYRVYCANEGGEGCVGVCDTGVSELNADNVVQMTPCDGTATSEKWCCGNKKDCCAADSAQKAVIVPRKLGEKASSSSSTSSSPTAAAPDSSAMPSQQPSSTSDAKWKIGLGVGIGVGLPVMLVLGIVLGMFCFKRKRQSPAAEVQGYETSQSMVKRQATDDTIELETPVSELWGDRRTKAELP
ncbi:hypothetical protein DE146DRAFT_288033 [Phaeosphaeria sp. MPI-PUGE-AT-0046c]|nr:hypothetical protein DE146DRAFT_288033 [Phaeosphaeria sp. MPI-PUGE-AT-0046c]